MLLVLALSLTIASGQTLAEYRPGVNFGQIFKDYSGSGNHAVNGNSWTTTTGDTWPTDRGAYFNQSTSAISMPPNDLNSSFALSSNFTILGWFMSQSSDGILIQRQTSSIFGIPAYFSLIRRNQGSLIEFDSNYTLLPSLNMLFSGSSNSFPSGSWVLITVTFLNTNMNVYSNLATAITQTLQYRYFEFTVKSFAIGGSLRINQTTLPSFSGYAWYVLISSSILSPSSYVSSSACSSCLTPICTKSVIPTTVDPYLGAGCICTQPDPKLNCAGVACPASASVGCSGSTLLNCNCTFPSCKLNGTSTICDCPSGTSGTYSCCGIDCGSCTPTSTICTSCISLNASPSLSGGCLCNSKYFNTTFLNSTGACMACNTDCQICSNSLTCSKCIDSNALPLVSAGCSCKTGYYNKTSLSTNGACLTCNKDCSNCNQGNLCISCVDSNASPSPSIGCFCKNGYYNTTTLNSNGACLACHSECSTCSSANICLSCKDPNSSPSAIKGCLCNYSYYNITALSAGGTCLPCNTDCKGCANNNSCTSCIDSNASPGLTKGCSCNNGFFNSSSLSYNGACQACNSECSACSNSSTCKTCIALNSSPSATGCSCNLGFYNTSRLISSNACKTCQSDCASCSSGSICSACKDSNALASTTGCYCKPKYFNNTSLSLGGSCLSCNSDCATCGSSSSCLTCADPNASPSASGCKCNNGYFNTTGLGVSGSCLKCNLDCSACSLLNTCTACTDPNALPNLNSGCKCKDGYYNATSLNFSGACLKCNSDCGTCSQVQVCLTCVSSNAVPYKTGCICNAGYHNTTSLSSTNSCLSSLLSSITLASNTTAPNAYFNYLVTVSLFDQSGGSYSSLQSITLASLTLDLFSSSLTTTTSTGKAQFLVYSKAPSNNSLQVTIGPVTGSLVVQIMPLKLKIQTIAPTPIYTRDFFQVKVLVFNNDLTELALYNRNFSVSLGLNLGSGLSVQSPVSSLYGQAMFGQVRITLSGSYYLIASCPEGVSDSSSLISVSTLTLSHVLLEPPSGLIYMNFYFQLSVTLLDQSGALYNDLSNVTLLVNDTISGVTSFLTSNGTGSFDIMYPDHGDLNITAICSTLTSASVIVTVNPSIMIVSFPLGQVMPNQPSLINQAYLVSVTAMNYDLTLTDQTNSFYSLNLSITPQAQLTPSSLFPIPFTSGSIPATTLTFSTSGIFLLSFSSPHLQSSSQGPFLIIDPNIAGIVVSSPSLVSINVDFYLSVCLKDSSGNDLISPSAYLTISSESFINGSKLVLVNTSCINLTFYSELIGVNLITVSASNLSSSILVNFVRNYLKIDSVSPTPSDTSSLFSVSVGIYNYDFFALAIHGTFLVNLLADCNGTLSGNSVLNSSSGVVLFNGLKITTQGVFHVLAQSSGMTEAVSQQLIIGILLIQNISASIYPSQISACQDFEITVQVFDQFSVLYKDLAYLQLSSNCTSLGYFSGSTMNGSYSFILYSPSAGACDINITGLSSQVQAAGALSLLTSVNILQNVLVFSEVPSSLFTAELFKSTVCIYDNQALKLVNTHCSFLITLSLQSSTPLIGTTSVSTIAGCSVFINLNIPVSDLTNLQASSAGLPSAFSLITIKSQTIKITSPNLTPTIFFDNTLTLKITDESGEPYQGLNITIEIPNSNSSTLHTDTGNGTIYISFYFTSPGQAISKVSTEYYSETLLFTVSPGILLAVQAPSVLKYLQIFNIQIAIYDSLAKTIESAHGPYSIQLVISNNDLNIQLTNLTSAGISSFFAIQLNTTQNFNFQATCAGFLAVSGQVQVTAYSIPSIIVVSSTSDLHIKNLYLIQGYIFDKISGYEIVAAGLGVKFKIGESAVLTNFSDSKGNFSFQVILNETGLLNFSFYYSEGFLSFTEEIFSSNNTDQLCLLANLDGSCKQCVGKAYLQDGICKCFEKSKYNLTENECFCDNGTSVYDNSSYFCAPCGRYFSPSDISLRYSQSYKNIFVLFSRPVDTSKINSCSDIVLGPADILPIISECVWISVQYLRLDLLAYPSIKNPYLELNHYSLQYQGQDCGYNITALIKKIEVFFKVPSPFAKIESLDVYSLQCFQRDLFISTKFIPSAVYEWGANIIPSNENLTKIIQSATSNSIQIPRILLAPASLEVFLTVTFLGLNTFSESSKTILIDNSVALEVALNVPGYNEVKPSQSIYVTVLVLNTCGSNSTFTYNWSSPSISLQKYLKDSRNDAIFIPAFTLTPQPQLYLISVKITAGVLSGQASTLYNLTESPLIMNLTRSSGVITNKEDFQVNCTALDPDNSTSVITKTWLCVDNNQACLDSAGANLVLNYSNCYLTISKEKLKDKANYTLTVIAETYNKVKTSQLTVLVDSKTEGVVEIYFPPIKINPHNINNFIPVISFSGNLSFSWTIAGDLLNHASKNPFIGFLEFELVQGVNYKLTLQITSKSFENKLTAYGEVYCNIGPVCDGMKAVKGSNWVLSAEGCVDGDGEDYPLMYQFGVSRNNKVRWLTELSIRSEETVFIAESSEQAYVRVVDSVLTESVYHTNLSFFKRDLGSSLIDIKEESKNPLVVPALIMYYSEADLDYSSFYYLYSCLYNYFSTAPIDKFAVDMLISALASILNHTKFLNDDIINNATFLSANVLTSLSSRLLQHKGQELLAVFDSLTGRADQSLFNRLITEIGKKVILDVVPDKSFTVSSEKIIIVKQRRIAEGYIGNQVLESSLEVYFPKNLTVNESKVLDSFTCVFYNSTGINFYFYMSESGIYDKYTLKLSDVVEVGSLLNGPLVIIVNNSYNFTSPFCENANCYILNSNKTHISVSLTNTGCYIIKEARFNCSLIRAPLSLSAVLVFAGLALGFYYYISDNKKIDSGTLSSFKKIYLMTGLFHQRMRPERSFLVLRMMTKCILLISLVGVTYTSYFQFLSHLFSTIPFYEVMRGVLSLAVFQVFNFISMFFVLFNRKLSYYAESVVYILISASSVVVTALVCFVSCPENVQEWLIIFGICVPFEVVGIDAGYSYLASKVLEKKALDNKVMPTERATQRWNDKSDVFTINEGECSSPKFAARDFLYGESRGSFSNR